VSAKLVVFDRESAVTTWMYQELHTQQHSVTALNLKNVLFLYR